MAKTTIEFSKSASEELGRVAELLGTSKADVLRNGLALYSYIANELRRGGRQLAIVLTTEEGDKLEKIIAVPGIQTLQSLQQKEDRKHIDPDKPVATVFQ
jgi:hypothetical protein